MGGRGKDVDPEMRRQVLSTCKQMLEGWWCKQGVMADALKEKGWWQDRRGRDETAEVDRVFFKKAWSQIFFFFKFWPVHPSHTEITVLWRRLHHISTWQRQLAEGGSQPWQWPRLTWQCFKAECLPWPLPPHMAGIHLGGGGGSQIKSRNVV